MFQTRHQVIAAIERVEQGFEPRTSSLLAIDRSQHDPDGDPFHPGFLSALERRTEVIRLLKAIDPRSRMLLILCFVEGRPMVETAKILKISRVHCYRLRNNALDEMLLASRGSREAVEQAS
jgi:DNA-directed RNA polymerase specialized sigma subunit